MLYGGIADSKNGHVGTVDDVYFMKIGSNDVTWTKETVMGDEKPVARSQHIAISTGAKNDRVFIFGGHYDPKTRLNDTWFFNVKDMEWSRVGGEKDNLTNAASTIGAPGPRANAGAILYENKIYVHGGHGGTSFARISFSDIFIFDLETEKWEKIIPNPGTPVPEGRGGHSVLAF
jgi:N-acetylneuraminic acid mutarotase